MNIYIRRNFFIIMNKFFKSAALVAAAMTVSASAFAQSPVGKFSVTPKLGLNVTNLTGTFVEHHYSQGTTKLDLTNDYRVGFTIGAEAGYQVTERFGVTAGLLYSLQGYQLGGSLSSTVGGVEYKVEDNSKLNLHYINVPILANFYLFKGFAVKAGIQPGFLASAKFKNDVTYTNLGTANKTAEEDVKDELNTFDFSIPVGVSYEFRNGIMIDGRYNIGLTKVAKDSDVKSKNSVFQIMVGYKFTL